MNEKARIILFMLALTVVFGGGVSLLNSALAEKTRMNRLVAKQTVLLELLDVKDSTEQWSGEKVASTFEKRVEAFELQPKKSEGAAPITCYRLSGTSGGEIVLPMSGMGYIDLIEGYMAVDVETKTVVAIDFTNQTETPGLGGRISEPDFKKQFKGLDYSEPDDEGRNIRVLPSSMLSDKPGEVAAITGATNTSRAVERILNQSLKTFLNRYNSAPDRKQEGAE